MIENTLESTSVTYVEIRKFYSIVIIKILLNTYVYRVLYLFLSVVEKLGIIILIETLLEKTTIIFEVLSALTWNTLFEINQAYSRYFIDVGYVIFINHPR